MDKKQEKAMENSVEFENAQEALTVAKPKKQLALKIVTAVLYALITIAAITFDAIFIPECFGLTGWEGLALIVLIPMLIIIPAAAAVLYLIPLTTSVVGLILSGKKKSGKVRKGRIFFGVFIGVIILSAILVAIASVAAIIAVKLTNG